MKHICLKNKDDLEICFIKNGFNQRIFSEKIGITDAYLSLIMNGKKHPSAKVAKQIVEILNCDFSDIFFIQETCKS